MRIGRVVAQPTSSLAREKGRKRQQIQSKSEYKSNSNHLSNEVNIALTYNLKHKMEATDNNLAKK